MSRTIHFLTSNPFKIETAQLAFEPFEIEVSPVQLNIPEIQADTNAEIALHAAQQAVEQLGKPVMREDHGLYLNALSGWPGPYMAHAERTITPQDVLRLLDGRDRSGYFQMALAYVEPSGKILEFTSQLPITIIDESKAGQQTFGWDSILSIGDDNRALTEYSQEERYPLFTENFVQLAERLV